MHAVHRMAKEIGEVKPKDDNLPDGWQSKWSPEYMRLYYFNLDLNISTWTHPPTEATSVKQDESEQRVSNQGQQSSPTSFFQISATDDGYDAERARYIQMVDMERSEVDRESFEQRRAAYVQMSNKEGKAEALFNMSQ